MAIFKWMKGGTFAEHKNEGERLFKSGDFGEARMAFQRALKKSKNSDENEVAAVREKLAECAHQLAMKRLETARELFRDGEIDRAYETLDDVLLICDAPDVAAAVEKCGKEFDEAELQAAENGESDLTDDDLLAVIAGSWSPEMAAEFAEYPESFHAALVKAHDGNAKEAVRMLDAVETEIALSDACYFFLEKARLQLASDDLDGAEASVKKFIDKAQDGEADEVSEIWVAWQMLATIHTIRENFDDAEQALMKSYRAAPDNHVPMLHLGVFLRERGELERAKQSLKNAMDTMGAMHPDMRVLRELGLTYLEMNARHEAIDCFKSVLAHNSHTVGHEQYDPDAAIPLAKIYEEDGKLQEASDIYRHLANGYDTQNHFSYNLEAARLLMAQNAGDDLVGQYLESADLLARTAEQREALERLTGNNR